MPMEQRLGRKSKSLWGGMKQNPGLGPYFAERIEKLEIGFGLNSREIGHRLWTEFMKWNSNSNSFN